MMPTNRNININIHDSSWWKIALAALVLYVLFLQLYHLTHYPLWRDDAFFAIVAKNLANGDGYSAVFFDEMYKFHHGISSGPLLIMPAALMIFIFGNKFWVPGLTNIILIWSLLLIIFHLSREFLDQKKRIIFCFWSLLLFVVFVVGSYGNENFDNLILLHALMGEVPAALCVIIASFLLFSAQIDYKKIICGGLFLGVALLAKTITAIALAVIIVAFVFYAFSKNEISRKKRVIAVLLVTVLSALPFTIFELVKLINFGWSKYWELQCAVAQMYRNNAVLTGSDNASHLQRLEFFLNFFGVAAFFIIPVTTYLSCSSKEVRLLALVLAMCFLMQMFWWFFLSTHFGRHLVTAFAYYFVAFALVLSDLNYKQCSRSKIYAIVVFALLLFVSRSKEIEYLTSKGFQNDAKLKEQLMVIDTIEGLQNKGVQMISCGNNFELEYLLPRNLNFKRCDQLISDNAKQPLMLVSYFVNPTDKEFLRVNQDEYIARSAKLPEAILGKCGTKYLVTENYSLNWCD